jgi:hypothetical protein
MEEDRGAGDKPGAKEEETEEAPKPEGEGTTTSPSTE